MTTRTSVAPRLADVFDAAERIAPRLRRTPLLVLDELPGVLLKAEHLQQSGSFKIRGATNAMLAHGARRVVAGSSGNHGIALASLGAAVGAHVTIVMAAGASAAKAATLRRLGAEVVTVDGGVADRECRARQLAEDTGALLVPSADDELIVAGQGTVALEILAAEPEVDAIYVPTGGGGLLAGTCLAAAAAPHRRLRVVGVEPVTARRYARSLAEGRRVELPPSHTIADGLRGQRPGEVPFPIIRGRVDAMIGVTDEAIGSALRLLHRCGVAAEPTGAVALAGALQDGAVGRAAVGHGRTAVIVSGGNTAESLLRAAGAHPGSGNSGVNPSLYSSPCSGSHSSSGSGSTISPIEGLTP